MLCGSGNFLEAAGNRSHSRYICSRCRGVHFPPQSLRFIQLGDWKSCQVTPQNVQYLIAARFREKSRDEWCAIFDGTDACVAPILRFSEAVDHPHMKAREVLVEKEGIVQPQPAPRFSRTVAELGMPPAPRAGAHTRAALAAWGIADVDGLIDRGIAVQVEA